MPLDISDLLREVKKISKKERKEKKKKAKEEAERKAIRLRVQRMLNPPPNEWKDTALVILSTETKCLHCEKTYTSPEGLYIRKERIIHTANGGPRRDIEERRIDATWDALHAYSAYPLRYKTLPRTVPFCPSCMPERETLNPNECLHAGCQLDLFPVEPSAHEKLLARLRARRFPALPHKETLQ